MPEASVVELSELLAAMDLMHLVEPLAKTTTLQTLLHVHGEGRPRLLAALKEAGVQKLADRQKLSTSLAKVARGETIERRPPARRTAILDVELSSDLCTPNFNVYSDGTMSELKALPSLGSSPPLPGDSEVRPDAKIRLLCLYGAYTDASHFAEWARAAPAWLEVRAVELPGHGARAAEGVWSMGRQAPESSDETTLVQAISDERDAAVSSLVDLVEPLCHVTFALYGFSSGAQLAYLMTAEMQRRQQVGRWAAQLPFRLFACGRGAPHAVHVSVEFTRTLRCGSDAEAMSLLHAVLGMPVDEEPDALRVQAALWRAAIVPAMVSVPPRVPLANVPSFPLPAADESTCKNANPYTEDAPKITACPLIAIGSTNDKVWRWGMPARWEDVAAAGFKLSRVEDVPHFKLMCSPPVVNAVQTQLGAAGLAHARFG